MKIIAALFSTAVVAACSPVAPVMGGLSDIGVIDREKGFTETVADELIVAQVRKEWLSFDPTLVARIAVHADNGRVLLVGRVRKPSHRATASDLVWNVPGVTRVYNEISLDERDRLTGVVTDRVAQTELTARFIADPEVDYVDFNYEVMDGTAFIIGSVKSFAERARAIEVAGSIPGVSNVVQYIEIVE